MHSESHGKGGNGRLAYRARPSTTSNARSSFREVSESRRPMTRRIWSRLRGTILSVMICERNWRPFDGLASIVGRTDTRSCTSEEIGQIKTVDKSLSSSAWTTTPGRGLPNSLGTTASTTSPRFTATRSSHRRPRSSGRWRRFPDAGSSTWPAAADPPLPLDLACPAPNAEPDAGLERATAPGATPSAAAAFAALSSSGS
jgi:hypothetical protein